MLARDMLARDVMNEVRTYSSTPYLCCDSVVLNGNTMPLPL